MKRKRQFELVSAIIGIILGVLIALSGVIAFALPDLLPKVDPSLWDRQMTYDEMASLFTATGILLLVLGLGTVVVSALLCSGKFPKARMGLGIANCVLLGIILIIFAFAGLSAFPMILGAGVALTFEIISLATKDNVGGATVTAYYYPDGSVRGDGRSDGQGYDRPTVRVIDPFDETQPAPKKADDSVDAKLTDLKKLHDEGVIDDEQYRFAADMVVKSALGINADKPGDKTDENK